MAEGMKAPSYVQKSMRTDLHMTVMQCSEGERNGNYLVGIRSAELAFIISWAAPQWVAGWGQSRPLSTVVVKTRPK